MKEGRRRKKNVAEMKKEAYDDDGEEEADVDDVDNVDGDGCC